MEKLKSREHDFTSKLRQRSVIGKLREYILWQREMRANGPTNEIPSFGPVSINLDLTSACNFSCPHCVDSSILNTRKALRLEDVKKTIAFLHRKGLLSVILLGGGEPTLHPNIKEIIRCLKDKNLQTGIVTNGSRLERLTDILPLLKEKDWLRISLDAAREETFQLLHRPKAGITLEGILKKAARAKEINPAISLGYSFVIVWSGMEAGRFKLKPNVDEMSECVKLARDYGFDYVSFKPCLVRLEESQRESLLENVDKRREFEIVEEIRENLERAKVASEGEVRILESVNLTAMLRHETDRIKKQARQCHMQFFRTVVSPSGIFHCPAFRGVEKARIAENDGYTGAKKFAKSMRSTVESLLSFDARIECQVVGCFYHHTNWWLERVIRSKKSVHELPVVEDDNFFL